MLGNHSFIQQVIVEYLPYARHFFFLFSAGGDSSRGKNSGYSLEVEPVGFASRLEVGERRGFKDNSKVFFSEQLAK